MATKSKTTVEATLRIEPLKQGRVSIKIIGLTPLYYNAMSAKAKRSLLLGGAKKTAAEKKEIKHDPEAEYLESMYYMPRGTEAMLGIPATSFKNAMATAALVTDGIRKTEVQRLIFMPHDRFQIWGRPYLKMDVVRSADMNKTPDIRTRGFLPNWCAEIDIAYISPSLNEHSVIALLANAGIMSGVGDFRQEKGKGSYGTFAVVSDSDQEKAFKHLQKHEGRECQNVAITKPECMTDDEETRLLWAELRQERMRRAS